MSEISPNPTAETNPVARFSVAAEAPAQALYDADAAQSFTFRRTDEEGEYEVEHIYGPLTDAALIEYDELRSVVMGKTKTKGEMKLLNVSLPADEALFDTVCERVDGYGEEGEEAPENWKELITADEKQQGVNTLLACELVEPERREGGKAKRRKWGAGRSGRTIPIRAYFDGREVELSHTLPAKTAKNIEDYEAIRSEIHLTKGKSINQSDMKIPGQMEAKGALYDRMGVRATGYKGRVPLHHKAFIITEYFDSASEVIQKK